MTAHLHISPAPPVADGFTALIGETPLVLLRGASRRTGCRILGKCEFLNPGGSVKDRAAWYIIRDAEKRGILKKGGTIVEGTAGNTGIGLALVANARGYRTVIVMPESQSLEKRDLLRMCGAELRLAPAVPYKNPQNYVRAAETLAREMNDARGGGVIWANQFDNLANRTAHEETTGPEIWRQTGGEVDAFTCSVGTGGTLAGVGLALKKHNPAIRIILADPMGSALYHYYACGTLKAEGNSITEGIGQGRITANLEGAAIDGQLRVQDEEALQTVYELLKEEGLSVGGSSGINVCAAEKLARRMGKGHTVVTMLCDDATRYQSKLFNAQFLKSRNLPCPSWLPDMPDMPDKATAS